MVQSETFVSRRKKRVERRAPRKLFTARGLVGDETQNTDPISVLSHSKENDATLTDEPKANMSKPQLGWLNKEKIRRDHEMAARCDETRNQSSHRNSLDLEREEFSRSSSLGNSLDDVMQMGCMDSLFFSGAMNKSRTSIFPLQHDKRSIEAFMTLPLPNLKFMKQDEGLSGYVQSKATNFRGRLDCHLPYQHITDQGAEAQLLTTIRGHYFGFDRQNNRAEHKICYPHTDLKTMGHNEWNIAPFNRRPAYPPALPIESPPSQIFIGELPCLSDELIPVDDMPFPGFQCNLTKYHPKPLTLRQNYAFGEPMLSVDSDESDPTSQVSGKNNLSERNEWHSPSAMEEGNIGTPPFDDRSCPSFDEAESCSVDRGTNETRSESFIMALDLEVSETGSTAVRGDLAASVDRKSIVSDRSAFAGGASLAGSAATDQAITSEIPKKLPISLRTPELGKTVYSPNFSGGGDRNETLTQQPVANLLLKKKPASISSSMDDDNISNIYIQDENNSPPHMLVGVKSTSHGIAKRNEQSSLAHCHKLIIPGSHTRGLHDPPYQVPSITEGCRKPFELMFVPNIPNSPGACIDDEFVSPKANSPKNRSNAMISEARRFRFEDSFDESEFFDTMA